MKRSEAYRTTHDDYEGTPLYYDPWESMGVESEEESEPEPESESRVVDGFVSRNSTVTNVQHPIARMIMAESDRVMFSE